MNSKLSNKNIIGFVTCLIYLANPFTNHAYAELTSENFATSVNTCLNWSNTSNFFGPPDFNYANIQNKIPVCTFNGFSPFNIPTGSTIKSIIVRVYNSNSDNVGVSSMSPSHNNTQLCIPPPFFPGTIYNGIHEYVVTPVNCPKTFPTIIQLNSTLMGWKFFNSGNVSSNTDAISMQVDYYPAVTTPTVIPTSVLTPTPSVSPTPAPFLELPWDYKNVSNKPGKKTMTFNEAALAINSYFDHTYPLLSTSMNESLVKSNLPEAYGVLNHATTFENTESAYYSSHDGYDYGTPAQVEFEDDMLAAAAGTAVFTDTCKPCGNAIHINHPNGYQTRYYHLEMVEPFIKNATEPVQVNVGQKIGTIGYSGNIRPNNEDGSHIHFMVIKDMNSDSKYDYTHDIPFGLTDPFGWMPNANKNLVKDPWEESKYVVSGQEKVIGNKSNYLWINRLASMQKLLTNNETKAELENYSIDFPQNSVPINITLYLNSSPLVKTESAGKKLQSTGPALKAEAYDALGELFKNFLLPFTLTIKFDQASLYNIDPGTLSIYSSNDRVNWIKENTVVDTQGFKAVAQIGHFTYFALMGEIADQTAPVTEAVIIGEKGTGKWFRSNISLTLNAMDNEGGLGNQYTTYKLGDEWQTYEAPLSISNEGSHSVQYYTEDKGGNIEEVKTVQFTIDKIAPVSSASVAGTEGIDGWYRSDVSVNLSAEDNGEVDGIEYSLDGGENYGLYADSVNVSTEGIAEVLYRAVDRAGNVEVAKSVQVKIDKTAPSSLVYTTGSFGKNGWYKSDVVLSLNALEDGSGYDETFYSLDGDNFVEYLVPLTINAEGVTKVYYYSIDKAGNEEVKKVFNVKIDKTVPFAEIQYDITAQDIKISGRDNSAANISTSAVYTGTTGEVLIEDQAGHTLKLFVKDKEKGKNARLSVVSLQYNGAEIITMDKNMFSVKYDYFDATSNSIKKFDQDWKVNDLVKLNLSYATEGDFTTVKNRMADGTVATSQISGRKFLKVTTDSNILKTSY